MCSSRFYFFPWYRWCSSRNVLFRMCAMIITLHHSISRTTHPSTCVVDDCHCFPTSSHSSSSSSSSGVYCMDMTWWCVGVCARYISRSSSIYPLDWPWDDRHDDNNTSFFGRILMFSNQQPFLARVHTHAIIDHYTILLCNKQVECSKE